MAHSLTKHEAEEAMRMAVRLVAIRLNIYVEEGYNLVASRKVLRAVAGFHYQVHKSEWTLFINKKGDKALAVDYRGGIHILPDSPDYLHALRAPEHAINYFVNELRKSMQPLFTAKDFIRS